MRRGLGGYTPTAGRRTKMVPVSARRALLRAVPWRRRVDASAGEPPVFWGRVGAYEGVTRHGVLLLLAPEPAHPAARVRNGA
jgi:hypothetical protein